MTRIVAFVGVASALLFVPVIAAATTGTDAELRRVEQWRSERVAELTGDDGWLNLVGLFWLDADENTFGRAPSNRIVLDSPSLAASAGSFTRDSQGTHFIALPGSGITHEGQPVSAIDMLSDAHASPTVLASGSLRFFIIERSGKVGVRVRDLDSQRRRNFKPITYFPVTTGWVLSARFEPYEPHRHIRIVNILGLEDEMDSPGTLVFNKDGHEWRLDAILESPGDQTLFVMFADATSGKESYGGGRFLYVPLPAGKRVRVDFNESYNPPCAFNDFSTCPLPPYQNRLTLRIEAGEKSYGPGHSAGEIPAPAR
jgi:uncharacterized protein (DUF1684 family)